MRQKRLEGKRESKKRKQLNKTDSERQLRLRKKRNVKEKRTKKVAQLQCKISQQDYLNAFDSTQNGSIEEQCWAKTNIDKFVYPICC